MIGEGEGEESRIFPIERGNIIQKAGYHQIREPTQLKNGRETQINSWSWRIALLTAILVSKLSIGSNRNCFSGRFDRIYRVFMADICDTHYE